MRHVRAADIVIEARIDAARHLPDLAGAPVHPVARRRGGRRARRQPHALQVAIAELLDGAAAIPAIGRCVLIPPWIVPAQHGIVPVAVLVAGAIVKDRHIAQPGPSGGDTLDPLPAAGRIRHTQIGVVDDLEPARAAELHLALLAGQRVHYHVAAPPSLLLKRRGQPALELAQRGALGDGIIHRGADIGQDIESGNLGDGEITRVLVTLHVAMIEGDGKTLAAEGVDRLLRRERLKFDFVGQDQSPACLPAAPGSPRATAPPQGPRCPWWKSARPGDRGPLRASRRRPAARAPARPSAP